MVRFNSAVVHRLVTGQLIKCRFNRHFNIRGSSCPFKGRHIGTVHIKLQYDVVHTNQIEFNYMSNIPSHNNDLSIPEGVTFVGSINVPGVAQINGDITGEITCKELEVGPQGNIKGKIQAQGIEVHGQLENDINCKGLVKIFKTGKVSGTLSYLEIDIERGGQFSGVMSYIKS